MQSQLVVHTCQAENQGLVVAASGVAVWPAKGRIGFDDEMKVMGAWVLEERLLTSGTKADR